MMSGEYSRVYFEKDLVSARNVAEAGHSYCHLRIGQVCTCGAQDVIVYGVTGDSAIVLLFTLTEPLGS